MNIFIWFVILSPMIAALLIVRFYVGNISSIFGIRNSCEDWPNYPIGKYGSENTIIKGFE